MNNGEQIIFEKQSTYRIGAATYQVTAHFNDGEDLVMKVRRMLKNAARIKLSQRRQLLEQDVILKA